MICPGFVDPRYPRFTAKQFHDKLVEQGFHLSCTGRWRRSRRPPSAHREKRPGRPD